MAAAASTPPDSASREKWRFGGIKTKCYTCGARGAAICLGGLGHLTSTGSQWFNVRSFRKYLPACFPYVPARRGNSDGVLAASSEPRADRSARFDNWPLLEFQIRTTKRAALEKEEGCGPMSRRVIKSREKTVGPV